MTPPCSTCEMRSSCVRDRRCYRPMTLEAAGREVVAANLALTKAAERLNSAMDDYRRAFDLATKETR